MELEEFKLKINNKEEKEIWCQVDKEDYEELKYMNIYLCRGYPSTHNYDIHRYVMKAKRGDVVDHIDHNKLNNRKSNLRITTRKKNSQNTKVSGSVKVTRFNKFLAHIRNNKEYNVGTFNTKEEAYEAIDLFILYNEWDHKKLRYPEKNEQYEEKLKNGYIPIPYTRQEKKRNTTYFGIVKYRSKWQAYTEIDKKRIYLLTDEDPIKCARAYDKYIVNHRLKNRQINFPEEYDPEIIEEMKTKTECVVIDEKTVRLIIPTVPDKEVIVDKEDYKYVKNYSWTKTCGGYLHNTEVGKFHRFIMKDKIEEHPNPNKEEVIVDHIDGNIYDNRKKMLRLCTYLQNGQNRTIPNEKTNLYGISQTATNKYHAQITYNGSNKIKTDKECEIVTRWRDIMLFLLREYDKDHQIRFNYTDWTPSLIDEWKVKLNITGDPWKIEKKEEKKENAYYYVDKRWNKWASALRFNKIKKRFSSQNDVDVARWHDLMVMYVVELDNKKTQKYNMNFNDWTAELITEWKIKLDISKNPWS